MNMWLLAAVALIVGFAGLGVAVSASGSSFQRLVGFQLATTLESLILVLLAEGFHRDVYFDLAVVLPLMSYSGALMYVRYLQRYA